jgi:hypothetical protein
VVDVEVKFTGDPALAGAGENVKSATGAAGGVTATTVTVVEPTPVRPGVPGGHLGAPQAVLSVTLSVVVYEPTAA